jgi:hypothetical protein
MKMMKHIQTWLLITLLALSANGVVNAKAVSGHQNLSSDLHQSQTVLNTLLHQGLEQVSTMLTSESPLATKGGTYVLKDADGVVKRTGKSNNLDRRRGEHGRNSDTKDLEFEVDRRSDCCNAQRGREQIIYDNNPQAKSVNGGLNKRRPVSPTNRKRDIYKKAGEKL